VSVWLELASDYHPAWRRTLIADDGRSVTRVSGERTIANDEANAERIAACVNFLAGVPTAVLTAGHSDERALALAVLKGDESAAYGLADELIEKHLRPEGFVSREELVEALQGLLTRVSAACDHHPACRYCRSRGAHRANCVWAYAAELLDRLKLTPEFVP
jgi:hypothetical protein